MAKKPGKPGANQGGPPAGQNAAAIIAAIKADLDKAQEALDALEKSVMCEITALNTRIQTGTSALSAAKLKQRDLLYAKHKAIVDAQGDAAWQAVKALEKSDAVAELTMELDGLRDGLLETLQDLKAIEAFAAGVQAVVGAVVAAIGAAAGLKKPA